MPSSIAHASVAVLLSPMLSRAQLSGGARLVAITGIAAAIPDIDAIGRPFGRGDVALLGGHRAVTHSVFFAIVLASMIAVAMCRTNSSRDRWRVWLFAAAVVMSHGLLDALTTYGEGIAFLAPLSMQRWRSPWQPLSGLWPEVVLLWIPAFLMYRAWLKPRLTPPASLAGAQPAART